jgi:Tfp pilus assembly protein PilN
MRPVNLIPSDQRRDGRAPLRGGPLAYIVVGALVLLLAGVTLIVLADNRISDREAEIAQLEGQVATAQARAAKLSPYTRIAEIRKQRIATVTSLADSRFDWERVMRELALILPGDVWLTNLAGTVSPEVSVAGSGGIAMRSSVPGPALELVGCASGQDAVAGFVSALKDIDGVTRVGVQSSKLGGAEGATSSSDSAPSSSSSGCQTRKFIAQFQIVAAFDAAPAPSTAAEGG